MAENQRLIRLQKGHNGFFCPDSRLHLIGGLKPQAFYPEGLALSDSVKRGLRGGSLVDVYGTCQEELTGVAPSVAQAVAAPVQAAVAPVAGSIIQDPLDKDPNAPAGKDSEEDKNEFASKSYLTGFEIDEATLKDLQAFIEGNQIPLEDLNLNSRSKLADVREALKKHFGH